MRNSLLLTGLIAGSALVAPSLAAPAAAQPGMGWGGAAPGYGHGAMGGYGRVGARVWVEDDRDFFRVGDRLRVNFSLSDDAYVAVVHVDTEGNLDFLFPVSPWDNEYVRGGGVYSLPARGAGSGWTVRGRGGIGYFFLLASPYPLEFGHFRGIRGAPWDWGYAGRMVRGDPFLAFQQITRFLLPGWPHVPYVYDIHAYHVGGLHRFPGYACSDHAFGAGWGWTPRFGSCDRLDLFLRDRPFYYDVRRAPGDRFLHLREFEALDPRHGFKEPPDRPARGRVPLDAGLPDPAAEPGRAPAGEPTRRPSPSWEPGPGGERQAEPPARRPTLERRPSRSDAGTTTGSAEGETRRSPAAVARPAPPGATATPSTGGRSGQAAGGRAEPAPRSAPAGATRGTAAPSRRPPR